MELHSACGQIDVGNFTWQDQATQAHATCYLLFKHWIARHGQLCCLLTHQPSSQGPNTDHKLQNGSVNVGHHCQCDSSYQKACTYNSACQVSNQTRIVEMQQGTQADFVRCSTPALFHVAVHEVRCAVPARRCV